MKIKVYIIEDYKNYLSKKYQDKYGDSKLTGKALTDELVAMCLGVDSALIQREEGGKPYIISGEHFSVSHSDNVMAIAKADFNIGIDIQFTRDLDVLKLARRYFSQDELEMVRDNPETFYELWTAKEAYCKFTGRGLAEILEKKSIVDAFNGNGPIEIVRDVLYGNMHMAICYDKGDI